MMPGTVRGSSRRWAISEAARHAPRGLTTKILAVFVVDTNETELTIPFGN
jgi:hypothetical protein